MAAFKPLFILMASFVTTILGSPVETPPITRNTIFFDERLEGEIFEDVDIFSRDVSLLSDADHPYRLPTTTRPLHYDIFWAINMTDLSLTGSVQIYLEATQPGVNEIVIQSADQDILNYTLLQGNTNIPVTMVPDTQYQFIKFILHSGNLDYDASNSFVYTLSIDFASPLRDDMYGIYSSWYRNNQTDENDINYMATTQFQSTAGRSAFPCYDEPSFKATFSITIRRPLNYTSWSCTRLSQTLNVTEYEGYEDDVYHTTPVMSTYLLAIIVAQYETITNEGTPLKYEVIARPAAIQSGQGEYVFDVGQRLLQAMTDYTAMDFYSVHDTIKMTQAAIPDFSAGAMENWGLLTYREAYLMYDENNTNSWNKQIIARILSHEIAHMWFGNLVTCDWWDVTWLNEGFARYYQYFLTDWVEEYMGMESRFITEQLHTALLSDSANNPHPLTNPGVNSNAAVSAMFSTISYNKGACIIRMTEHLMRTEIHTIALQRYLRDFSFDVVLPIDLFQTLQDVGAEQGAFLEYGADFSLIDYYRSWTEQPGHPVLNVNVDHHTGEMTIIQRRFNINTGYSTINTNYIVPITFATASDPDFTNTKPTHIIKDSITLINRNTTGDEWVIFNKQQTGYYRVNYDDYTWDLIIMALRSENRALIHEYNKAQIVDDVFQFARSGLMTYSRAFNILSFLENETEYTPWEAAITGFNWIRNRLAGTTQLTQLENMIANWASNLMSSLTYYPTAGEDYMVSYMRYQLATHMCNIRVPACRTAAESQFRALVDDGTEVPVDNRNWVYCNALRLGNDADFDYLMSRFQSHPVYTEKLLILQILGCTNSPRSLTVLLNYIIEDNFVIRPQDYLTAFNAAVSGNEGNAEIVLSFIKDNLDRYLNSAFANHASPLATVISRLRNETEINSLLTWANENQQTLGSLYNGVVENARLTLQSLSWSSEVAPDMNNYFTNGNNPVEFSTPAAEVIIDPVTVPTPELVEPESPDLSDSAVTSLVSMVVVVFAVIANIAI